MQSLTKHLKDASSPVNHYLKQVLPSTEPLTRDITRTLSKMTMIRPTPRVNNLPNIGMAIDYRMRFAFEPPDLDKMAAASGGMPELEDIFIRTSFFDFVAEWLCTHHTTHKLLSRTDEETLLRMCYVFGLYEETLRSRNFSEPLLECHRQRKSGRHFPDQFQDFLAIPNDDEVQDLYCIVDRYFATCSDWFLDAHPILNPIFLGSSLLKADGDLIVKGTLFDIKCIQSTNHAAQWLRQLAGYLLLDFEEDLHLTGVGFYFARHGCRIEWPIDLFIRTIGVNPGTSLSQYRREFKQFLITLPQKPRSR